MRADTFLAALTYLYCDAIDSALPAEAAVELYMAAVSTRNCQLHNDCYTTSGFYSLAALLQRCDQGFYSSATVSVATYTSFD
jgi:hypothetical protein